MKYNQMVLSVVFGFAVSASPSWAQSVSFSDSVFNDADWTASVISHYGPTPYFSALQVTNSGNQYRRLSHSYGGRGDIWTGHLRSGAIYNPALQGAITGVDVTFDIMLNNGGDSNAVGYGALLVQAESYYRSQYVLTTLSPVTGVWQTHSFDNLVATDFAKVAGPGPDYPDFTKTGSSIQFGYFAYNGTSGRRPTSTLSGLDNWTVLVTHEPITVVPEPVTVVPEPSNLVMLTTGLFTLLSARRRLIARSRAQENGDRQNRGLSLS